MKFVDKKLLEPTLGKAGFFRMQLIGAMNYVAGIAEMDQRIHSQFFFKNICLVNLVKREQGLEINMMQRFKQFYTGIHESRLTSIVLEYREQIYVNKQKSVIGRAIIGESLYGSTGAIVGALSALEETQEKMKMPDLFIAICYINEDNQDDMLVLSCNYDSAEKIDTFFRTIYPDRYEVLLKENVMIGQRLL